MVRFSRLLALVASLAPSIATAQTVDVETVGDSGADPRNPTATVTTVPLNDLAGDDVATAIDQVPGVHSRRTSYGQSAYATVRGSNSRQVLVEYEGLRLSPPFGPGFDLGGVALGFDAVSIWRGAAATYRGSGALAGVLEFRTIHPRRPGTRIEASVLRGSQDTLAGAVGAAVATRSVSTRVGVGGRMTDGDFSFTDAQGTTARRVNNDHRRGAAYGSTELRDGKTWFRATALTDQGERGTPGLSEFQDQFSGARLQDSLTAAIVGVGSRDVASPGPWSIDAAVRAGAQRRDYEYSNPRPFLQAAPILEQTKSTTVAAVADATAWGPTSVARVAFDAHHDDWRAAVEASRTTVGVGASWEQVLDDSWLVVAAARGEVDSDERVAALPAAGARFSPDENWTVQANVGRTFRSPNLDELYLELETVRGNPDLTSEQAWVGVLGTTWQCEHFAASVVGFGRIVESEILFLPVTAYLLEAQNIEGTWAAGAEAGATLDLKPVRATIGYTFTAARFRETNTPVPLQPEHAADGRVSVSPIRSTQVWTAAHIRGPVTLDLFGNTRDSLHAFWDIGLYLGEEPVRVALSLKNVFNDDAAVDATQQPQPGRTFWASIRLRWEDVE